MWVTAFDLPDREGDRVRALIAIMDKQVGELAPGAEVLAAAWAELSALLVVGPSAASLACPRCGRQSRADATRCVYCWTSLVSEAEQASR